MLTTALFPLLAAAADTVDVTPWSDWRRQVRAAIEIERARCGVVPADLHLNYEIRVAPDGTLTDAFDPAGPPHARIIGRSTRWAPDPQPLTDCFERGLAGLKVAPPPGGRAVTMPFWVEFGPAAGSARTAAPGFAALTTADLETRRIVAEVLWRGEDAVWACLDASDREVAVQFVVSRSGDVASAEVTGVPVEREACVRSAVLRWRFPSLELTEPFVVHHVFEADLVAPLRAP